MPLPVLSVPTETRNKDLLRFYNHTEQLWTEHLAEAVQLEACTAYANAELSSVFDANRVLNAALPPGMEPARAVDEVNNYFSSRGCQCSHWTANSSVALTQTQPLVDHLIGLGYQPRMTTILRLASAAATPERERSTLRIIPARASFKHVRILAEEAAARRGTPALVEASLLHLDDPHWDCFLALDGTTAVGMAGVLSAGNIGRVDELFVSQRYRRRGIGQMLMGHVLETSARSLLKHVLVGTESDNSSATALYEKLGFVRCGNITSYAASHVSPVTLTATDKASSSH